MVRMIEVQRLAEGYERSLVTAANMGSMMLEVSLAVSGQIAPRWNRCAPTLVRVTSLEQPLDTPIAVQAN